MGASPLRAVLGRISSAARQPLARAALTSAVVMTAGDVLCQAALKTLTGQLTLFPVYLSLFFLWSSALEGKAPRQALQKLRGSFAPVYRTGWVFWPLANMVNFLLVPPTGRVLYVNCAGLLWNTYLSYSNADANARQVGQLTAEDVPL